MRTWIACKFLGKGTRTGSGVVRATFRTVTEPFRSAFENIVLGPSSASRAFAPSPFFCYSTPAHFFSSVYTVLALRLQHSVTDLHFEILLISSI